MAAAIPDDVRRFIREHIGSVSILEVLLLLRRDTEHWWRVDDVAAAITSRPGAAEGFLRTLRAEGLLEEREGRFRYAVDGEDQQVVDALADAFARRRHSVINLIFERPDDSAQLDAAQTLAEAFRLRRRDR